MVTGICPGLRYSIAHLCTSIPCLIIEIQSFPPSLSDLGKLHLPSTMSGLLKYLEHSEVSYPPPTYDFIVLDGAVKYTFYLLKS